MEVEKKGGNSELVLKYHVDGRQKSLGPNAGPLQIYKYCVFEERAKKKIARYSLIFKMESLPWDFIAFEVFFPRPPELRR